MEFKERLRKAIDKAGDTQAQAATKIVCSPHSVTYWLAGGQPRLPMYERICAAYPELREPLEVAS